MVIFQQKLYWSFRRSELVKQWNLLVSSSAGVKFTGLSIWRADKFKRYFSVLFAIQLDNYEVRPGKRIKVNISIAKVRLFVGNIPKQRSRDEIMLEFSKMSGETDSAKLNRVFSFLNFHVVALIC